MCAKCGLSDPYVRVGMAAELMSDVDRVRPFTFLYCASSTSDFAVELRAITRECRTSLWQGSKDLMGPRGTFAELIATCDRLVTSLC